MRTGRHPTGGGSGGRLYSGPIDPGFRLFCVGYRHNPHSATSANMNIRHTLLIFVTGCLTAGVASAQIMEDLDWQADNIQTLTNRNYDDEFDDTFVETILNEIVPVAYFNQDFSALGATEVTFSLSTPEGQYFEAFAPDGFGSAELTVLRRFGNSMFVTDRYLDNAPTFSVNFMEPNTFDSEAYFAATGPGGNMISGAVNIAIPEGERIRFDRVSLTTTIPAGYDVDYDNVASNLQIYANAFSSGDLPDPGPMVALVPEPASATLLLGGLVLLAFRRRGAQGQADGGSLSFRRCG